MLRGDHLALLGDADGALNGASGLRQDSVVADLSMPCVQRLLMVSRYFQPSRARKGWTLRILVTARIRR